MTKRVKILIGMGLGFVWAIGLIWVGANYVNAPVFALLPLMAMAFVGPGLALLLIIARLAQRRFFDDAIIDGQLLTGAAGIDQRVLTNTIEQTVLALTLWPAIAYRGGADGPGMILALGVGFFVARLAFWGGYHWSPPLRAFGFAATFYPTIVAGAWALWGSWA